MKRNKYLNTFETTADYNNYIESALPEFPNVGLTKDNGELHYMRTSPNDHLIYGELVDATQNIPDIQLYNNNRKVKTYTPTVDTLTKEFYIDDWGTIPAFNKLAADFLTNKLNIKSIKKFKGLDTSSVTNMDYMFSGCKSLTSLDLSNFNTSSVTKMDYMFSGCSSLTSLDLSNFNTSSVTSMIQLFASCSSLTSLDLSNCDFSSVTKINEIFSYCSSLTSLDLSNCDFSSVTSKNYMFNACSSLTDVYINVEATLMKITNNLSSQGSGDFVPSSATIHYNNGSQVIDYVWQNNAWTPQS